jgi:hypothetical protein
MCHIWPYLLPWSDVFTGKKGLLRVARANRHHIPGQVWHITHRCHKKEFLLKFARDRRRWLSWLFEAKNRFGLRIRCSQTLHGFFDGD